MIRKWTGRFIHLYQDPETDWEFVSRKTVPYAEGNKTSDAVVIVPILRNHQMVGKRGLCLIHEFRPPMGESVIGLPAGLVDEGETFLEAAKRELHEETGLKTIRLLHSTPQLWSSEGLTDECVNIVYLEVEGELSKEYQEATENITPEIVTRGMSAGKLMYDNMGKVAYFVLQDFQNTGFDWLF